MGPLPSRDQMIRDLEVEIGQHQHVEVLGPYDIDAPSVRNRGRSVVEVYEEEAARFEKQANKALQDALICLGLAFVVGMFLTILGLPDYSWIFVVLAGFCLFCFVVAGKSHVKFKNASIERKVVYEDRADELYLPMKQLEHDFRKQLTTERGLLLRQLYAQPHQIYRESLKAQESVIRLATAAREANVYEELRESLQDSYVFARLMTKDIMDSSIPHEEKIKKVNQMYEMLGQINEQIAFRKSKQ